MQLHTWLIYAMEPILQQRNIMDPCKELRKHLIQCFEQGVMTPFPSTTSITQLSECLLYSCRLPFVLEHVKEDKVPVDETKKMIQCDLCNGWNHCSCVNIIVVISGKNILNQMLCGLANSRDAMITFLILIDSSN